MKSIEQARIEAETLSPLVAEYEAEFNHLKRREPSVLAECIADARVYDSETTYQWAKNQALMSEKYKAHLKAMREAEQKSLEYERSFRTVIEYIKAVTSENYKEQAKFKAGIL